MAELQTAQPPMDWFRAECQADELLACSGRTDRGTWSHRTARDVLALTDTLTRWEGHAHEPRPKTLRLLRHRLTSGTIWRLWCEAHLDAPTAPSDEPDLTHARGARDWLRGTPLPLWAAVRRGPVVLDRHPYGDEPGWSVGVRLARTALDTLLLAEVGVPYLLGRWVTAPAADGMLPVSVRVEEAVWDPRTLRSGGPAHPLAFRVRRGDGRVELVPADVFWDAAGHPSATPGAFR